MKSTVNHKFENCVFGFFNQSDFHPILCCFKMVSDIHCIVTPQKRIPQNHFRLQNGWGGETFNFPLKLIYFESVAIKYLNPFSSFFSFFVIKNSSFQAKRAFCSICSIFYVSFFALSHIFSILWDKK